MNRREFTAGLIGSLTIVGGFSVHAASEITEKSKKIVRDWKKLLTKERFNILFKEGTERPWSSELNNEKRKGQFICAACNIPLFTSETKYDSGTGWPSFYAPITGRVETKADWKLIIPRTEYHCARCGGHQGHVFKDGPKPTGKRYCNNGLALMFIPQNENLPELR